MGYARKTLGLGPPVANGQKLAVVIHAKNMANESTIIGFFAQRIEMGEQAG